MSRPLLMGTDVKLHPRERAVDISEWAPQIVKRAAGEDHVRAAVILLDFNMRLAKCEIADQVDSKQGGHKDLWS